MNRIERKQSGQLGRPTKLATNKDASKPPGIKAPESINWANTKVLPKEIFESTFNSIASLPRVGIKIKVTTPSGIHVAEGTLTEPISLKVTKPWKGNYGYIKFKLDNENRETTTQTGPLKIHWN